MTFHSRFSILFPGLFLTVCFILIPFYAIASYQPPIPVSPGEPENGKISFYEPGWDYHISFSDAEGVIQDFHVRGEEWKYRTTLGESKEIQQQAIRDWLNTQNITIDADVPDRILARVIKANGERITYYFNISRDKTDVAVYLERHLSFENPVSMTIGTESREGFDIWWDNDGTHYQSMIVEFEKDSISARGKTVSNFGDYERSVNYQEDYRIEHGAKQVIFDIPQYAGPYKWRIISRSKTPQNVKISLMKYVILEE